MADRSVEAPDGAIEITVNLASVKDGNSALREATSKAEAEARSQRRSLTGEYGTSRNGDILTLSFALRANAPAR